MPERTEIFVQHRHLTHFIDSVDPSQRQLRYLWIDATNEEQSHALPGSPVSLGNVYRLMGHANVHRGQRSQSQGSHAGKVYPTWICKDLATSSYVLHAAPFNPECVIMEFKNSVGSCLFVEVSNHMSYCIAENDLCMPIDQAIPAHINPDLLQGRMGSIYLQSP